VIDTTQLHGVAPLVPARRVPACRHRTLVAYFASLE
jgi:hypothetical protein